MFYSREQRSGMQGTKTRFLVTIKLKWKDFTTKKRA
jgi:hypothetical protein